ncbi:hypothetical protein [Pseudomonas saliphila]|uniref:hypothetical protein n=1 Tax=Pseudomonas saliphila TaxID=2586906 RepID=UPI001239A233|nr:hypothetical protein [Pseudomonas saliphila]
MPSKTLGLVLAIALTAVPVSLSYAETAAHEHSDAAHQQQGADANALHLDNGSQWKSDAPLRKAMAMLRSDLHPLMPVIHQDELAVDQYEKLADSVNTQVNYMIDHCELEGEADAQLHLIIADLMASANAMQGEAENQARRDGAIRMVGALNNYATYFDDESFEALDH